MSLFNIFLRKIIYTTCLLVLALFIFYMLPGSVTLAVDSEQEEMCLGGVAPLTDEDLEELESIIFRISEPRYPEALDDLPSKVKNTKHLPVVKSQGHLPTCAAFATTYYYKTYQEARERGWVNPDPAVNPERVASPAWGYIFGVPTSIVSTAQRICEQGIATWEEMPYDLPLDTDYWPTTEEWKRFAEWRGEQVGMIDFSTPEGKLVLKEHLAGGDLAVLSNSWYPNFSGYPGEGYTDNGVIYDNEGSKPFVGHALTLIGYDDDKKYYDETAGEDKKGAFLLVNSWGTNWGIQEPDFGEGTDLGTRGFMWIAYDYFLDDEKTEQRNQAIIMEDRIDYQPDIFALFDLEHNEGRKLFFDVFNEYEYGSPDSRHFTYALAENSGPVSTKEYGPIAYDISDFDYAVEQLALFLSVRQLAQFGGEGEVPYFALQEGDAPPFLKSIEVPVSIKNEGVSPISEFVVRAGAYHDAEVAFSNLNLRDGSIAWADFNRSGYPDLLISGRDLNGKGVYSGDSFTGIYVNKGEGDFFSPVSGGLPQLFRSIVSVADYNNSGYPDVAISGYGEDIFDEISGIYKNNGNLTFTEIEVELPSEKIESLHWVDLNNSGRPDLVVTTSRQALVYANRGEDNFELLEPLFDASDYEAGEEIGEGRLNLTLAFGDSNGNGNSDLAVIGEYYRVSLSDTTRDPLSKILLNQGNFSFTDSGAELPVLLGASAAWGDFTKNGRLDLAVTGYLDRPRDPMEGMTAVFQNNGDGSFTLIESDLGQAWNGSLAWGDLNNNGWLDLIVTGQNEFMYDNNERFLTGIFPEFIYDNQSKVFLNNEDGSFSLTGSGLPRVSNGLEYYQGYPQFNCNNTLALVDYNSNNSLDIFLSGTRTRMKEFLPEWLYTGIYRNDLAELYDRANTPPEPPTGLGASESDEPGAVKLTWDAGSDAETPVEGLYYNLRIGTVSGAGNIISGINAAVTPGRQLINGCEFLLRELPAGTYHWSVQTLDAGYTVSKWSNEATFTITEGYEDAYIPDDPAVDPDPEEPVFSDEEGRLAGRNRYETAIAISRDTYPEAESAGAVVLARGDKFPDALPGSVLAYKKNGPLLLVASDNLPGVVAAEIKRVLKTFGTIYVLGGENAVSENVVEKLETLGVYNIERLAGASRFETSVEIAGVTGASMGRAIVAYSHNFPDALAISSYAASEGIPIILSRTATLNEPVASYLAANEIKEVYVTGGEAVISEQVVSDIEDIVGSGSVIRLGGANRYETARIIAERFFPAPDTATLAFGGNFPDALAGGVNAAFYNAPILLVHTDRLHKEIENYLDNKRLFIEDIIVYGGTVVVESTVKKAAEVLASNEERRTDPWDIKHYIEEPIDAFTGEEDITIGNLEEHRISISIPAGALDPGTEVVLRQAEEEVTYFSDAFEPAGALYHFEIKGSQKRAEEAMIMKVRLDEELLERIEEPGGLRAVHYSEDYGWSYVRPREVNLDEGYMVFHIYHNWFWGSAELSEEERIKEYIDQQSREQWAIDQSSSDAEEVIKQVVEGLLIDGFNEDNPAVINQIAGEIATMIIDEKFSYADMARNVKDGDYSGLGVNLAKHTGTAIAKALESGTLGNVVKGTGTAAQVAGALIEGDLQGGMEHIANFVADDSKLYQALRIPREAMLTRINNWKNDELEQAYLIYRDGAEKRGWLRGYSVEAGNFDELWEQMAGVARQVSISALENYREVYGLQSIDDIPAEKQEELRKQARLKLQQQFETRITQEVEVEKFRENNEKIIKVFKQRRMLESWRPWVTDDQPMERILERLYGHIETVFKDTGRTTLIHDRSDLEVEDDRGKYYRELTDDDLVLNDVVDLILIRLSEGHEKYFEALEERGLLPVDHVEHTVTIDGERILVVLLEEGANEIEQSFMASSEPVEAYTYDWYFGDGNQTSDEKNTGAKSSVSHTYKDVEHGDEYEVKVTLSSPERGLLAEDTIKIVFMSDSAVAFTNPAMDGILQTDAQNRLTVRGVLNIDAYDDPGSALEDIKLYRYTRNNDGPDRQSARPQKIAVEINNYDMANSGNFTIDCVIPQAEKVYALLAVLKFDDGEEFFGAVKTGSETEFEHQFHPWIEGDQYQQALNWSIKGLGRIFPYDEEKGLFTYEMPPADQAPETVTVQTSLTASYWESGYTYSLATNVRTDTQGALIRFEEEDGYMWVEDEPDTHGPEFSVIFQAPYNQRDQYLIGYIMLSHTTNDHQVMGLYLRPWPYYSRGEIIGSYMVDTDN